MEGIKNFGKQFSQRFSYVAGKTNEPIYIEPNGCVSFGTVVWDDIAKELTKNSGSRFDLVPSGGVRLKEEKDYLRGRASTPELEAGLKTIWDPEPDYKAPGSRTPYPRGDTVHVEKECPFVNSTLGPYPLGSFYQEHFGVFGEDETVQEPPNEDFILQIFEDTPPGSYTELESANAFTPAETPRPDFDIWSCDFNKGLWPGENYPTNPEHFVMPVHEDQCPQDEGLQATGWQNPWAPLDTITYIPDPNFPPNFPPNYVVDPTQIQRTEDWQQVRYPSMVYVPDQEKSEQYFNHCCLESQETYLNREPEYEDLGQYSPSFGILPMPEVYPGAEESLPQATLIKMFDFDVN